MTDKPEVTQADRDAAAEWMLLDSGAEAMRAGGKDDHDMVQAFARHRTSERERVAAELIAFGHTDDFEALNERADLSHFGLWKACVEAALTTPSPVSIGELVEAILTDDPDWICAGIPDEAIEAGIAAGDRANNEMAHYVSGVSKDWDEGMIVAAVFKAVGRAILTRYRGEGK